MKFLRKIGKMFMMACAMAMFIVFGTVTLPSNPSTSTATVGKDYLLSVNIGTATVPVWTLVGGQRGSSLNRKASSIDVSHKTSGGWSSKLAGLRNWSIDLSGLVLLQDIGLQALEAAFNAGLQVNLQLMYPDGTVQTGWASITDFSFDNSYDKEATLKGTLEGVGALSDRVPSVNPLSVSVSKAAATDQAFTLAPSTTTVSSVKNSAAALTSNTDYTYSAGELVIKSTYLSGLTVGVQSISVTTGSGATLTLTINLTA